MKYDLVSIGSVVKDIILVTDRGRIFKTPHDRLAPEWLGFELGEKIRTDEIHQCLGGVATNISLGLKKFGFNTLPFSTIGEDSDGHWLIKELRKNSIKTDGIVAGKNNVSTPFSVILIDKESRERIIFTQKSSGDLDLASLPKFETKYLYVSSLKGRIKKQTESILNYLGKNKSELIVSPSTSQIRDAFPDLKKMLRKTKILILNKNEAIEIANYFKNHDYSIKNLCILLHKMGPEVVSITDGIKGAWVSDGKQILHSPIKKVKAVDSTGAGDAFASGFLGFYLKGATLKDSLKAGIANSASVVKYVGTTEGLLTKKELCKIFS